MKAEDDTRMTRNSKQRIKNGVDKVRREQALVYEKLQPLEHLGAEIDLCGAFEKRTWRLHLSRKRPMKVRTEVNVEKAYRVG